MRILLHICCAPDATVPLEEWAGEDVTGFFYGSNIHPEDEYQRRLEALRVLYVRGAASFPAGGAASFPAKHGGGTSPRCRLALILAPYRPSEWFERMEGLLDEPEGGRRCAACFELQLEAAAEEAVRQGCDYLSTSLTVSPHKDVERITAIGMRVCAARGLTWEPRIWRKRGGFLRSVQLSREMGLYRQNFCGCLPSKHQSSHKKGEA